jgi:hypothetical protein
MMVLQNDTEPDYPGEVYRMPSDSERRRGLRIRQERPIKAYVPSACRFVGGWTEDVSVTGLRLSLPASAPVKEGSMLTVHVGLSSGGEPLVNRREMMPARVVWLERGDDGSSSMSVGVEFSASIAAHLDAA